MEVARDMVKVPNNGAELVEVLVGEYKMTQAEIAEYTGVTRAMVTWWKMGKCFADDWHYGILQDMCLQLAGKGVRYPKQAMEVLKAEDEENKG